MNKNSEMLGNESVGKLLMKLSTPAIIGMMIIALYNLVDTAFLGNSPQGISALNALAVSFPIQGILMAVTLLYGVGASSIFSVALGEGDTKKIKSIVGTVYTVSVITGVIIAVFGIIYMDNILRLFSTPEHIIPLAKQYLSVIFVSNIVYICVSVSSNIYRAEGNAKLSMVIMLVGAIINIVLDPFFIYDFKYGLGLGVMGAGLATAIGQVSSIFVVIFYSKKSNTVVKLYKKYIKIDKDIFIEICKVGFPSFTRNFMGSLVAVIMFYYLALYGDMTGYENGGELAQAVYGTLNKVIMFLFMPSFGVIQGMQPIIGFNYGAKKYDRIRKVLKLGTRTLFIYFSIAWLLIMTIPQYIIYIFNGDPVFISLGKNALRIMLFIVPLLSVQVVASIYFQATKKAKEAFLISSSRQLIFLIPTLVILPLFFPDEVKLYILFASAPVADLMSVFYAEYLYKKGMKELDEMEADLNKENISVIEAV